MVSKCSKCFTLNKKCYILGQKYHNENCIKVFPKYQVLHISTSIWVLGAPNTGRNMLSGNKTFDHRSGVCTRMLVEDHSLAEFCNKCHAFSSFFSFIAQHFLKKHISTSIGSAQHQHTGWILQQPRGPFFKSKEHSNGNRFLLKWQHFNVKSSRGTSKVGLTGIITACGPRDWSSNLAQGKQYF